MTTEMYTDEHVGELNIPPDDWAPPMEEPYPSRWYDVARGTRRQAFLVSAGFALAAALAGVQWLGAIGVGIFVWLFVRFLCEWGEGIPIDTLALVLAALQWVIGPILTYAGLAPHYKYYMYVGERDYMALAVPSLLCYMAGMYAFRDRQREWKTDLLLSRAWLVSAEYPRLPHWLIAVGLLSLGASRFAPVSLMFLFYLLAGCAYIGILYLLFSPQRQKWFVITMAAFIAALGAVQRGMFFNSLLWLIFIGMYASMVIRPRLRTKLVLILATTAAVIVLQGIKIEYRKLIWIGHADNRLGAFLGLIADRWSDEEEELLGGNAFEATIIRINQGWIVSRIMQQVPRVIPFAEGETILDDIRAALVPRILDPNKPVASGRMYYQRFTGYTLTGTSMGIGLLGESYANFGTVGTYFCLFLYGCAVSLTIRGLYRLAAGWPTLVLWLPVMFLHVVKAEAEFLTVINYCVRGTMVTVAIFWFCTRVLHLKM